VAYRSIREKKCAQPLSMGENDIMIEGKYFEGLAAGSYVYILKIKDSAGKTAVSRPGLVIIIK
jgi:hypothetical protein